MIQWIVFAVGSILLIAISWTSLHHPDSHGFYRFFAWEAILALIVINASKWFSNWLAWYQIISWILSDRLYRSIGIRCSIFTHQRQAG